MTVGKEQTELLLRQTLAGSQGNPHQLFDLLYGELRNLAQNYLRQERADHTLQPTALVHEAWMKLVDVTSFGEDRDGARRHFFGIAARAMRQILVDHARRRGAAKRSGDRITLNDSVPGAAFDQATLIDIDDALKSFANELPRAARVAELRLFGGLTVPEIARLLDVSDATAKVDWRMARATLSKKLGEQSG